MRSASRIRSITLASAAVALTACSPDGALTSPERDPAITRSALDGRPLDGRRLSAIRARAQGCLVVTGLSNGMIRTTAIAARALPFELPALPRGARGEAMGASVVSGVVHYETPGGYRDSLALSCLVPESVTAATLQ